MPSLDHIKTQIKDELKHFDGYFKEVMKTDVPLLNMVMQYLLRRKGKQMRPVLVFLSAKLHGNPNDSTFTAAALIELLHTATLIHDDVVDDSNERRGFFSINALWKSKVAVLTGDYLLARGLLLAINKKEYQLLDLVANAVKEMSEGELQQIRHSRKLNISESEYFDIIRKKTAALLACCSSSGAKSVDCSDDTVNKMHQFGELLGIAFQIKDDLLDYQINRLTGKPAGNDIQEKKLTLPLIHALETADSSERNRILRIVNNSDNGRQKFNEVFNFVNKHDGISYAEIRMNEYANKALDTIREFDTHPVYEALKAFSEFVIRREK